MLVLQEFSDRSLALSEMCRVTRPGGVVAACQWDFARMPVIAALVEAIGRVNPMAGRRVSTASPAAFVDEAEILRHWRQAGFVNCTAERIAVSRTFTTFDHLWSPLLAGSTPSTLTLAALTPEEREAVRVVMESRFVTKSADGALQVTAEALVMRGSVPRSTASEMDPAP